MNKDITIVLLSHKSTNLILKFISEIYNKYKIIIIENSEDLILKKKIEDKYPKILIKFIKNNGYGSSVNYASKLIKTKYFLISNPDVSGMNEENINKFIYAAKKLNNNFSALGPRFVNADPKSHKQSDANLEIAEIKFISGSCMFFQKEKFDAIGGFDENFFLYFEESDFCMRSFKKNKNYQINTIEVLHEVGTSVFTKNEHEKEKLKELCSWHFIWSKFYFYKKHYGFLVSIIYFVPIIIRILFKIILFTLKREEKKIKKYKTRWSGLISSIKNQTSYKRID
jgi:N-acetylglucosaminyl-diphospho-decaprenol L-rhamnosyltransferase